MDRIKETEKLLILCEQDLKKIKQFHKELKQMEVNRKALDDYYKNQYMQDYEKHSDSSKDSRVIDQDSIWNVLSDQYNEKINLLKTIIKSI
ncbi:MAG: DUF4298 domain-containing protein [Petrimonas sp.]|nr:DUF4298 domain-containing protein [Petrimonas sp.]